MLKEFLSPSRHTMLLTQRSVQCSKTLSCRDFPVFPGPLLLQSREAVGLPGGFPHLEDVVSRSNSSISSNHRVPQHLLNNDVP